MHVFITGSTGWIGTAIVKELIAAGHEVSGLTRSQTNADALTKIGGKAVLGSTSDLGLLRDSAAQADGVIHTAFGLDMSKLAEMSEEDRRVIETFADVLMGSDRPFIVAAGIGIYPRGHIFTEEMSIGPVIPAFPRATEQTTMAMADRGVRATVVRLPRCVHGVGERHGFIPQLASLVREKGVSAYIKDGENLWPSVHHLDAARVFRLALEHGAQGGPFHAVAEQGIPFRHIAEALADQFSIPVVSLSQEDAAAHFGMMSMFIGGNGPASSERTRKRLGWVPQEQGLIADISQPEYFAEEALPVGFFGGK